MGMRGGPGMGRGAGHMAMMFGMLDLSDAQKAKMRDIHERQMRSNIQARADLQLARMDMAKLMRAENPDQAAINAQVDKMAKMRADVQKSRIATMLEARAQLTPEQRKKLDAMRANGPMGMHGGPGMGGPGMHMMHGQPGAQGGNAPAPTKPKAK
ncbi:MAG: Spy/CpxP family protein refolding chaperone [Candidatus Eisenbacteria bacterium]